MNKYNKNKKTNEFQVNAEQFSNIKSPEAAYILGILWADGYVYQSGYQNRVLIECVEADLKEIEHIFNKTGDWFKNKRNRQNRKPQMTIGTNNKHLVNFLIQNDYTSKSIKSACKILSVIPDDLKHYWFRGLIDGDGCFYVNKECNQFSVAGPYEQDWSYLEKLCKQLQLKYVIKRREQKQKNKINKSSILRITNIRDIARLGEYIYNGYALDGIGLKRKYEKFLQISKKEKKSLPNGGQSE